jgi:saccharopine dehydrogenase-like NADP-dependent oxidoreductase
MARVLVLGGGGTMAQSAIASAAGCSSIERIVVADRDLAAAERAASAHPGRAEPLELDITDKSALARALGDASAVVNCAGPYYRLGTAPLEAAIDAGRIYLDLCDDWETMQAMLALDARAQAANTTAIVGMGASPGLTNLLARVACDGLDRAERVIVFWTYGAPEVSPIEAERRGGRGARAAARHFLHQASGEIVVRRDGAQTRVRAFTPIAEAIPGFGMVEARLVGHPESIMLPLVLPQLVSIETGCILTPSEALVAESLAAAIAEGRLDAERAAVMMLSGRGLPLGLRLSSAWTRFASMFSPRSKPPPVFALAEGMKSGERKRAAAWLNRLPKGASGASGVPLAVALKLAVTGRIDRPGVSAPEQALDPYIFFEEFAKRTEALGPAPGPLIHVELAAA